MPPNHTLRFLRAAVPQLKDYLLSNEIFWNLGFDPQLTLGNLLLAEAEAKAGGELSAADRQLLADISAQKKEWQSAWQKKAEREFASRLRQWSNYITELTEKRNHHASAYKSEVRLRVLLELLAEEAPSLRSQLATEDSKLKALTTPGDFTWASDLEVVFPKSQYWFLWMNVK